MRCLLFAATCCLFITSAVHFLDLHRCDWRGSQTGCNVRMIRSCCPILKSSCSSVSLQPCEKKILIYCERMYLYILTHARHKIICRLKAIPKKKSPQWCILFCRNTHFFLRTDSSFWWWMRPLFIFSNPILVTKILLGNLIIFRPGCVFVHFL